MCSLQHPISDLKLEMNLYTASYLYSPHFSLHTTFPATILTKTYENEDRLKHNLTSVFEDWGRRINMISFSASDMRIMKVFGGEEWTARLGMGAAVWRLAEQEHIYDWRRDHKPD